MSSSTSTPAPSLAPLSIVRNGNAITLGGDLPDADAHTSLVDTIKDVFGSGVQVTDNVKIRPGSNDIGLSGVNAVLKAADSMPDFTFKSGGDTVTLAGTAASEDEQAAVEAAAAEAFPDLNIVNDIGVKGSPAGPSG